MKYFRHYLAGALILVAAVCIVPIQPAKADDGPDTSYLGVIEATQESAIRMDKELVEFTVSPQSEVSSKATFWFSNPTDKEIVQPSVFPMTYEGPGGGGGPVKYASNVRAKVNGVVVKGEVKYASYPYATDESNSLNSRKAEGYAFPFTVAAHGNVVVELTFETPLTYVDYLDFNYYLGSGAGWAGTIGEAKFVVHYPVDLEEAGWVKVQAQDVSFKGQESFAARDYSIVFSNLEPVANHNDVLSFSILPPDYAKALTAARGGMEQFTSAGQWQNLADVYRTLEFRQGQYEPYRPAFAVTGYWQATNRALMAAGVNRAEPTSVRQAIYLAELFSDHWAPVEANAYEVDLVDLSRYEKVMAWVKTQDQNQSPHSYGLRIQDLLARDEEWRGRRPDLFDQKTGVARADGLAASQSSETSAAPPELPKSIRIDDVIVSDTGCSGNQVWLAVTIGFIIGLVVAGVAVLARKKRKNESSKAAQSDRK